MVRRAEAKFVDTTKHDGVFNVKIKDGFVSYTYLFKNTDNNKGILLEVKFNDGYFRDLKQTVSLFMNYCKTLDNNVFEQDEMTIAENFHDYVNPKYEQNFVFDEDFIVGIDHCNWLEKLQTPKARDFDFATQKIVGNNQLQNIDVAVFGVPSGFDDDYSFQDLQKRHEYTGFLQMFYDNGQHGIRFVINKKINKQDNDLVYSFVVYPHNKSVDVMDYNCRGGGMFGFSIILKNACFTNQQQVFKVLSDFYRNYVLGKYIIKHERVLKHNFKSFKETNMKNDFYNYINQCIHDGKLELKTINIPYNKGKSLVYKEDLSNVTQHTFEQVVQHPDFISMCFKPENNNPFEYKPDDSVHTVPVVRGGR